MRQENDWAEMPILLLNFNRPHLTKGLVDTLREFKPRYICAAVDGPRQGNQDDVYKCAQTIEELKKIDWPCDLKLAVQSTNLGLERAVPAAIDFFFSIYEKGIILEDDIRFSFDFLQYCSTMLMGLEGNTKVAGVSGNNFVTEYLPDRHPAVFLAQTFHCWGWATWKDRWQAYHHDVLENSEFFESGIDNYLEYKSRADVWKGIRNALRSGGVRSWAWRFQFSCWEQGLYFSNPSVNLASNVGFGEEATNTKYEPGSSLEIKSLPVDWEKDVSIISRYPQFDSLVAEKVLNIKMTKSLDLGCGAFPKNLFQADEVFGIDVREDLEKNILTADLVLEPIPFSDGQFDFVTAHDFIEHIPRLIYAPDRRYPFIELMNEIYRVLKVGGLFLSFTPCYPKAEAFRDPTHVNIITEETFPAYFDVKVNWGRMYGFKGGFEVTSQEWRGPHLLSILRKVAV